MVLVAIVAADIFVVFDFVDVDLVEVNDRDVAEAEFAVVDVVLVEDIAVAGDAVDVVVVVVSQPMQVLAHCVMLATRLSHKPKFLKAMHWLCDSVSLLP